MATNYLTRIASKMRQTEQKSDQWLLERRNMITGSECFKAANDITQLDNVKLNLGADEPVMLKHTLYDSDKQAAYIRNKVSTTPPPFIGSPAVDWGCKFEAISRLIHQGRTGLKFAEYGLVPHRNIAHFGASPDGLSTTGPPIALEIKNAYGARTFHQNKMKLDYWFQCQFVMFVLNSWALDPADKIQYTHFLETRFCLYNSMDEYFADKFGGDGNCGLNSCGMEKGMLLRRANGTIIYPTKINCPISEMGFDPEDIMHSTPEFWSLTEYNLISVPVDPRMETVFVPQMNAVWGQIAMAKLRNKPQ